jgi:hypothetical protein
VIAALAPGRVPCRSVLTGSNRGRPSSLVGHHDQRVEDWNSDSLALVRQLGLRVP